MHRLVRGGAVIAAVSALAWFAAPAANARPVSAPVSARPASPRHVLPSHHAIVAVNASSSNNWAGYNRGALETATPRLFNQVSADWTVPTATQHTPGHAASSSTWIGIGGGCLEPSCLLTDPTLIQTGTEQDVDASGVATYSAWYEVIPLPSIQVSLVIKPGDRIHADLHELVAGTELWVITLADTTSGASFSITLPYPSLKLTAEWIEETPLLIGTNAGFSTMPNLSAANFDNAQVNGAGAALTTNEQIDLVNGTARIATPSAPDVEGDGFNVCTYTTTCATPGT